MTDQPKETLLPCPFLFPIILGNGRHAYIPFEIVQPHEDQAKRNHGQTLKRLAERGGLRWMELYCVLTDKKWDVSIAEPIARARVLKIWEQYDRSTPTPATGDKAASALSDMPLGGKLYHDEDYREWVEAYRDTIRAALTDQSDDVVDKG